jgi:hypothetical protein
MSDGAGAGASSPAHDPGPPSSWEGLFAEAPLAHYIGHASGRFRLHFGPVFYRSRLDGTARVLVLGQDPGTDELLGHRSLVGQSGQRVQRLLGKLGVTRSYVMFNAFLFGVFGQFDAELRSVSEEPPILDWRNRALDAAKAGNWLEAVLAFGAAARHAIEHWPSATGLTVFTLTHPSAPAGNVAADWNRDLPAMIGAVAPDGDGTPDPTPYGVGFGAGDAADIPRFDLPFGVPGWHGTGGTTRSARDGDDRLVWTAPAP